MKESALTKAETFLRKIKSLFIGVGVEQSGRSIHKGLDALLNDFAKAIWTCDENGKAIHDSTSWRDFTGQTWEEYRVDGWQAAIHPEDREAVVRLWKDSVATGKVFETEYRLHRPDGTYDWTFVRGVHYKDEVLGERGWIGINLDISARKTAEHELSERNLMLNSIIVNSPSALSVKDADGRYLIANKNFDRLLGLESEKMLHQKDTDIFTSEVAERLRQADLETLKSGKATSTEEKLLTKDGRARIFKAHRFPILDSDQRPRYIASIALDITDSKQSASDLAISEARMNSLVTTIPQLVWTCLPDGQCNYLSPQWEEFTGIPAEKQLGLDWLDQVIYPEDRERTYRHWMGAVEGKHSYDIEYRIKKHDGSYEWFKTRGTPIRDNPEGKITYWFGTCTNIDEDIKLRESLERKESEFRTLANSIPQLAWMANSEGWLFWYNDRWFDYTGTTIDEMSGWGWEKVHDPAELPRVKENWAKAIATGDIWEDTFPLRSKSGEWRHFLSRARPVKSADGKVEFWFGTNTDVTEQLKNETELKTAKEVAERANFAKSQFLANMSHEIRTPIGAIMGFTGLLKDPKISVEDRDSHMKVIERNSEQLLRLIDDILDLSKVEIGKVALENSEFSLPDFLAEFASVMLMRAVEKGIKFVLITCGLIPDRIGTDQLRLKQILSNIIGNAIKFTDAGTVKIVVEFENEMLKFKITDTGAGISKESIPLLFRPFGQGDPSMSRRYGGSGLGLILSKRLSVALGGDLILQESEADKGSTFVVTVRPKLGQSSSMINQSNLLMNGMKPGEESRNGRLGGMSILVVEDSPDNRMLLGIYLGKTGAKVEMAKDGIEGVDAAVKTAPDVVIMDIQMPRMDGHLATRKLRASGFTKPIIALTAHAMREEREQCFESGFNEYLTKPVNRDQLLRTLEIYRRTPASRGT